MNFEKKIRRKVKWWNRWITLSWARHDETELCVCVQRKGIVIVLAVNIEHTAHRQNEHAEHAFYLYLHLCIFRKENRVHLTVWHGWKTVCAPVCTTVTHNECFTDKNSHLIEKNDKLKWDRNNPKICKHAHLFVDIYIRVVDHKKQIERKMEEKKHRGIGQPTRQLINQSQ